MTQPDLAYTSEAIDAMKTAAIEFGERLAKHVERRAKLLGKTKITAEDVWEFDWAIIGPAVRIEQR